MIGVVRSSRARDHVPGAEIWLGMRTPGTEVPERVDAIEAALADWPVIDAVSHDDSVLVAVHDGALIEHLRTVWDRWGEYGADRVVPYLFPTPGLLGDLPLREPTAVHGAAGMYGYDTMTLIGPGTWEAARGAVDVALTCVDAVGDGVIYGLTRPPGHHVTRSAYGGSCYLNNAAVAAEGLRRAGHQRISSTGSTPNTVRPEAMTTATARASASLARVSSRSLSWTKRRLASSRPRVHSA